MPETSGTGNHKLKAVIFDMDNTLFEFVDAQVKGCKAVVDRLGAGNKIDLFDYFLREVHDFEDYENISDYMHNLGIHDPNAFFDCCASYDEAKLSSLRPYDGIRECLQKLKQAGLKLAVVTNANRANAAARLEITGLLPFFDLVVPSEATGKKKPDPEPVRFALEMLGVKPDEALFIGDSLARDIAAGKASGVLTAYAAYGDKNFNEGSEAKADFVLSHADHICRLMVNRFSVACR